MKREDRKRLIDLLGKRPDIDLAAEFDITRQTVSRMRRQRKIPAYNTRYGKRTQTHRIRFSKSEVDLANTAREFTKSRSFADYTRGAVREVSLKIIKKEEDKKKGD